MQKEKRWVGGRVWQNSFRMSDYLAASPRMTFLSPYEHLHTVPEKNTHGTKKKQPQQNFESSDIITHRLQAKNCLLLRYYWLLGWRLHHIKPPCQVGAFGRSTTRECSFPLMFWTSYCREENCGSSQREKTTQMNILPQDRKCFVSFYF